MLHIKFALGTVCLFAAIIGAGQWSQGREVCHLSNGISITGRPAVYNDCKGPITVHSDFVRWAD